MKQLLFTCIYGICILLLLGYTITIIWYNFRSAPFVPSSSRRLKELLQELKLTHGKFADLGSGDGRMVFTAARLGLDATGWESNWYLYGWSQLRRLFFWKIKEKIHFTAKSFLKRDMSEYDVIYLYLFPDVVQNIIKTCHFKSGAMIICKTFNIDDWEPVQTTSDKYYIYRVS